jgi:hypothetical protein
MTRPRRGGWRWWGKWTAAVITVLLAAAWLARRWWVFDLGWSSSTHDVMVSVGTGAITVAGIQGDPDGPGFVIHLWRVSDFDENPTVPVWRFLVMWETRHNGTGVSLPLWAPASATLLASVLLFCLDRRRPPNSCPHCHYDLSATPPSSPCPECGRVPAPKEKAEEARASSA